MPSIEDSPIRGPGEARSEDVVSDTSSRSSGDGDDGSGDSVEKCLASAGLGQFAAALIAEGYDELWLLRSLEPGGSEVSALADTLITEKCQFITEKCHIACR